jgi:hypothetical protein
MRGERPGPAKRQRLDKDISSREEHTRNPAPATAAASRLKRPVEIDAAEDSYVCHITIPSKHRFHARLSSAVCSASPAIANYRLSRQEKEGKLVSAKRIKTKSGERFKEHSSAITVLKSVEYAFITCAFRRAFFANVIFIDADAASSSCQSHRNPPMTQRTRRRRRESHGTFTAHQRIFSFADDLRIQGGI